MNILSRRNDDAAIFGQGYISPENIAPTFFNEEQIQILANNVGYQTLLKLITDFTEKSEETIAKEMETFRATINNSENLYKFRVPDDHGDNFYKKMNLGLYLINMQLFNTKQESTNYFEALFREFLFKIKNNPQFRDLVLEDIISDVGMTMQEFINNVKLGSKFFVFPECLKSKHTKDEIYVFAMSIGINLEENMTKGEMCSHLLDFLNEYRMEDEKNRMGHIFDYEYLDRNNSATFANKSIDQRNKVYNRSLYSKEGQFKPEHVKFLSKISDFFNIRDENYFVQKQDYRRDLANQNSNIIKKNQQKLVIGKQEYLNTGRQLGKIYLANTNMIHFIGNKLEKWLKESRFEPMIGEANFVDHMKDMNNYDLLKKFQNHYMFKNSDQKKQQAQIPPPSPSSDLLTYNNNKQMSDLLTNNNKQKESDLLTNKQKEVELLLNKIQKQK